LFALFCFFEILSQAMLIQRSGQIISARLRTWAAVVELMGNERFQLIYKHSVYS
jgi:hypothetical protein